MRLRRGAIEAREGGTAGMAGNAPVALRHCCASVNPHVRFDDRGGQAGYSNDTNALPRILRLNYQARRCGEASRSSQPRQTSRGREQFAGRRGIGTADARRRTRI